MKLSKRAKEIIEILPESNPKRSHYMDTNRVIEMISPKANETQRKSIRRTLKTMREHGLVDHFTAFYGLKYYAKHRN